MSGSPTAGSTAPEARLLVVDDEPNIRELLSASLRYAGFEVETASDGQQALAMAETFRPDLLLLDVMMPGLDGFERRPPAAPVGRAARLSSSSPRATPPPTRSRA